jgi:hypothetical protein
VVSAVDLKGHNLGFLDWSRYFSLVAPQLYSWSWVDSVPDPLLLRNLVVPGIEPGTSGSVTGFM